MKVRIILFMILTSAFFLFAEDFWMKLNFDKDTRNIFYTAQDEIYISTDSSIFVSKDYGNTWDSIPDPPSANRFFRLRYIDETGNYLIASNPREELYITHKNTINWDLLGTTDRALQDIFYKLNDCLFALHWGGISKSNEDWTKWTKVLDTTNNEEFNAFVIDSTGTVFTGSINSMPSTESGIYRSFDGGVTWELYPEKYGIMALDIDSENRIFAADFYEVLRSTDNGDTWQSLQSLSAYPLCIHINSADEIYIGASDDWAFAGVAFSEDHGVTWNVINEGFVTSGEFYTGDINDMAECPDGYIYLATGGGVYRSVNSTTGIGSNEQFTIDNLQLEQNYPNPFNNETNISFSISEISEVKLSVYNIKGEFVKDVFNERLNKGSHNYLFKADDLNSGVYFYQLMVNGKIAETKKMIYLR
ncbi:MAG: T9SS type A sorting domain-containing protein [Candidatus Delongbacteria bacterium]|jgi:hypothetical protein|nr:T9SS type A sorting domain-containing protein [Candidatus Delongbacteria bacterium]